MSKQKKTKANKDYQQMQYAPGWARLWYYMIQEKEKLMHSKRKIKHTEKQNKKQYRLCNY